MALWGESRGLFAELETEFEAVVVGEQRTYVTETRVCHATGDLAGGTEKGEEFVAIERMLIPEAVRTTWGWNFMSPPRSER